MQSPEAPKVPVRKARALLLRVLGLARPEWKPLSVGLFMLGISSVGSLIFPQAIRRIIDGALDPNSDAAIIDQTALFMFLTFLVQGVAGALRFILFTTAGERVVARLRKQVFERILEQDVAFFDEKRTGDLSSSLASDTAVLQSAVSSNISMLLRNCAMVLGGVVMLFITSPPLTALMLAVVPAIAIGAVTYGKRVRRLARAVQDKLAEASATAEESIANLRTVRAFAAEGRETRHYETQLDASFALAKTRINTSGVFMGVSMSAAFGAVALVFWYGGRLVRSGEMSAGDLTSFLIYTITVAVSLAALADVWSDFMRAAGVSERLFALLDRTPTISLHGGKTLETVAGRIAFERVGFAYPSRPLVSVLKDFELAIEPGQVVALVGPSGAGKSTIAALLTRFYDPTEGSLQLDGFDLRELDPSWLRSQVGVVSQEPVLFSASIADNIRYGRVDASDAEVREAATIANAHAFIAQFPEGYETKVGERGIQLSGGQKQRVAIARAVLKDPRVLILDEATSALDAESEHLVREALERLREGSRRDGSRRTTLVIAHRLSTIADADVVVVLEGGRIAQSGTHQQLMREEGIYRRLVERQFIAA